MIENMRKAPDSTWKTKAFFNFRTKNFLIHGCRLVLAPTGRLIAHLPYKGSGSTYEPVIEFLDVDYLEAVTAQAVEVFNLLCDKKSGKGNKTPSQPASQEGLLKG